MVGVWGRGVWVDGGGDVVFGVFEVLVLVVLFELFLFCCVLEL